MRFKIIIIFNIIFSKNLFSQNNFQGSVVGSEKNYPIENVEIYDLYEGYITKTDKNGYFNFSSNENEIKLVFVKTDYDYNVITIKSDSNIRIVLSPYSINLDEVTIVEKENKFNSEKLEDIVENQIFAGKKTNKIVLDNMIGDKAANKARHIYNKIGGLNIFQDDDAGLQLNIGGRGLSPGRSSNFNVRQNNYDISADVLGYPESYYSPSAESVKEIQVVRGAASLQYGTQFGGLVNFVLKKPTNRNKFNILSRNTLGSNSLYTNFTSISEKNGNFSYYAFSNYKSGIGFRDNSKFESLNLFSMLEYQLSEFSKISFEITYLKYLAQQAGGLTDNMFYENIFQSNRERNWFKIDWILYNSQFSHNFNENNNISFSFFALDANRYSLGYRNIRVDQIDPLTERDLIKGFFNNYGFEARYLKKYILLNKKNALLTGTKYYKSNNLSQQGPGTSQYNANFNFDYENNPYYTNQSSYNYPNLNLAYFVENILYLDSKISITPGLRYEYINTKSNGNYRSVHLNLVDQPIFDTTIYTKTQNVRDFILFGIGTSYKNNYNHEIYSNISQNYRSVTFSDITINNPAFLIDPNITDESGYSYDLGIRGIIKKNLSFDLNYFGLRYNNRIGFLQKKVEFMSGVFTTKTQKGNIGDAFINGLEGLLELNIKNIFKSLNFGGFINYAYTKSEYLKSGTKTIIGNRVEFVPKHNLKCGVNMSYKKLMTSLQFTYLSDQYTDASNSVESDRSGILGSIPSYSILDFSSAINLNKMKLFFGVNNLLNNYYFTRRATGYPGPGIIPSQDRNYYITLEISY